MQQFNIKPYLKILYLALFIVFILNKTTIRPWVLEHDFPEWVNIFVLSLPNFVEAVLGSITLTAILLFLSKRMASSGRLIPDKVVLIISFILAGTYVITQELKIHNLGGRNVYDPYDLVASIIGLVVIFGMIGFWGILENSENSRIP